VTTTTHLKDEDEARIHQDKWRFQFLNKHHESVECKAWLEQVKYFMNLYTGRTDFKEEGKHAAKQTSDREYYDTLEECRVTNKALGDKELAAEIEDYKSQQHASLMLQADQEVAGEEREHIHQAAVRLGLINPLETDTLTPMPKWSRREPRLHTASLALTVARSRSASVSSMRKRGRSASLDMPHQSYFIAPTEPSPCPQAGEDDTPMNSLSELLTGSQIAQVKQELAKDTSLHGLHSLIHNPSNRMNEDSPPPQSWPSTAHSCHTTPAPDFTILLLHFSPVADLPPFTARLGNNNENDGPAPSDHTPTAELDPQMAAAHHITNCIHREIDW
jgi:hypothetical protein